MHHHHRYQAEEIAVEVTSGDWTFKVGAIAKGAGMIHPNMATMLCFITTDAAVEPKFLQRALKRCVDVSFNMITIDGDTSTNDGAVFANGLAGNHSVYGGRSGAEAFEEALKEVCIQMAKAIAADGEERPA